MRVIEGGNRGSSTKSTAPLEVVSVNPRVFVYHHGLSKGLAEAIAAEYMYDLVSSTFYSNVVGCRLEDFITGVSIGDQYLRMFFGPFVGDEIVAKFSVNLTTAFDSDGIFKITEPQ